MKFEHTEGNHDYKTNQNQSKGEWKSWCHLTISNLHLDIYFNTGLRNITRNQLMCPIQIYNYLWQIDT